MFSVKCATCFRTVDKFWWISQLIADHGTKDEEKGESEEKEITRDGQKEYFVDEQTISGDHADVVNIEALPLGLGPKMHDVVSQWAHKGGWQRATKFYSCRPHLTRWGRPYIRNQGPRLNIEMTSYQYRDSHYKDKTVSRQSYLHNGNSHTWKDRLYIETGPRAFIH